MNLNQVTLPSRNLARAVAFYQQLGLVLIVDSVPRYARFECPDGASTLSLHHVEEPAAESGVVIYFECEDLDARVARLEAAGIEFIHGPRDEHWLWREARLRDPDGNLLCLFHAGQNRRHPPWRLATSDSPGSSQ